MYANDPGTGFTLWLTGMPLAGKHSLAKALTERLRRLEKPVELIDGGEWEVFLGAGPGSTKEERNAITRRAGFFARMVTRAGGFAVVPQIAPYREMRDQLRREIGRFVEVYVDCPFETLMARDTKGLYLKAVSGEFPNFIGVTDPYEYPYAPEVRVDTSKTSIDAAVMQILEALVHEGALSADEIGLDRAPRREPRKASKPSGPGTVLFTPEMLRMPRPTLKPVVPAKPPTSAKVEPKPAIPAKADAKNPSAAAKVGAKKPATPAKVGAKKPATPAKTEAKKPATSAKTEAKKPSPAPKVEAKKSVPKTAGKADAKKPAAIKAPVKLAAKSAARKPAKPAAKKR
ncbi:MAG: putative adenylylsulfate kinase [Pseudomonadota bacterium]|jgi:adenylylsulfate kinase